MPIIIEELVVRSIVTGNSEGDAPGCEPSTGAGGAGDQGATSPAGASPTSGAGGAQHDIIEACVDEVLRILRESEER